MIDFTFIIKNPKDSSEKYEFSYKDEQSVWITRGDGEGGEFKIQALFDVINKFYNDNF